MVKKSAPENLEQPVVKKSRFKRLVIELVVVAAVAGAGYAMWKNPLIWQQIKSMFGQEDAYQRQIDALNGQIVGLRQQLANVSMQIKEPDLSEFERRVRQAEDKVAAMEVVNLNVINSKADVASVLGVVTRMDKAEQKLDKITAVDDESALILTAAMLVKDSAERGGSFEYEAEVLSSIAANQPKFKRQVGQLQSFAKNGIKTELQLVGEFDRIYNRILKEQEKDFAKTWKERLNSKLGEIVQIKKTNEEAPKFEADKSLAAVQKKVEEGFLRQAVLLLEEPENAEWMEKSDLQEWVKNVKNRSEFYEVIRQISASSLAVMKVNFLKKKGF